MLSLLALIRVSVAIGCILGICVLSVAAEFDSQNQANGILLANLAAEPIKPIPAKSLLDNRIVELGRKLFHDRRIGRDGKIACADCHNLKYGGADNTAYSRGADGVRLDVNTPTILNVSLNTRYYWSGRSQSLLEQIDDAILELQTNWDQIVIVLLTIPEYTVAFSKSYRDGLNQKNIKNAILTYEYSLTTPNSRFDEYLNGNTDAISKNEKTGYDLFKSYGCISCHQGVNVGGNMVQNTKSSPYFVLPNHSSIKENIRVPGLRNVALTSPYLHDGSINSLDKTVTYMGQKLLGIKIPIKDVKHIVMFLETLTAVTKNN